MTELYEEKLWGKLDFLHEKSLKEHKDLNLFSDIITKFQNSLIDFSKLVDNIKNKNAEIVEEKGNTVDLTFQNFKKVIKAHIVEFKECGESIKVSIGGPIIRTIDDKYTVEKEMYNQYNKAKSIYNNSKIILEKAKKDFESSAKNCEKHIHNLMQLKTVSFDATEDISKSEERMKMYITNTKTLEDKYYKCLEEANKARENEIKRQDELLKYYQIIHTDFYLKINCIISYFIPIMKKLYASILLSLDSLEDRCKKIKIGNDIDDFIRQTKSDLKPDEPIKFVPYYPEASLDISNISGKDKKELENLDINYKVLEILHENLREIRKDLNFDEEKKKYRLRYLCTKIFKIGPGMAFKQEEKNELISMLKEQFYKSYFLITLSKQRTKGRFQRSEKLLNDLSEILHFILDESEKINDYESAKNCIILSQTFFYEKPNKKNKKETKKIYLFEFIKNYKWFKRLDFWEGIIEFMIQNEIVKNEEVIKKNKVNESQQDIKNRLSNIGFSQVLSYSNSMIEFKINKEDITKVVEFFVNKYEIAPPMAESIYENIKNTAHPKEDEEHEKYFLELEEKYENRKNNIFETDITDESKLKRAQTIIPKVNNQLNKDLDLDTRSKSLKQKTTPYKIIKNEEEESKVENKPKEENVPKEENKLNEEESPKEEIKLKEEEEPKENNKIKEEEEPNKIKDKKESNEDNSQPMELDNNIKIDEKNTINEENKKEDEDESGKTNNNEDNNKISEDNKILEDIKDEENKENIKDKESKPEEQ